ncbi:MAG: ARMT1-like domain-containing protein [Ignavibacteria bacterium]|jgi:uncharacterized protein with ATP-grasp and redox domains
MFFDPACIPCIINQAYKAAKLFSNGDKDLQFKLVKDASKEIQNIDEDYTAPLFSAVIQASIEKELGVKNPYKKLKESNLKEAEKYIPYVQTLIDNSNDKIEIAIRAAITGNTIDLGANPDFDLMDDVNKITSNDIVLSALPKFKSDFEKAELILYIGDNYEEALFDKLLLNELSPKKIVYAVRSKPILNDVTLEDAYNLGIDKICEVMESGSKVAGTVLSQCTKEFIDLYNKADMVISKGQGNFETLLNEERPIYFLFKVKCDTIANRAGLPEGKGVLLYNQKK